jgi:hypothetical protein
MKTKIMSAALLALAVTAAAQAQTTLAGWSFGQFLSDGYPSVDGSTGDATSFIAATYRGSYNPVSNDVDGSITINSGATGYVDTTFGSWSFANFNINNASDVRSDLVGSLNTVNSTTLDGKQMHLTDSGSKVLGFNVTNTLWTITVGDTTGFTNVAGASNDMTFAATTTSGATIEWLYNGSVFATTTVNAPAPDSVPYAVYGVEFTGNGAAFYGTGVIQGRLTSGSVKFDNFQINGTAVPEASSFGALAGFAGLVFAGSRRRRA